MTVNKKLLVALAMAPLAFSITSPSFSAPPIVMDESQVAEVNATGNTEQAENQAGANTEVGEAQTNETQALESAETGEAQDNENEAPDADESGEQTEGNTEGSN